MFHFIDIFLSLFYNNHVSLYWFFLKYFFITTMFHFIDIFLKYFFITTMFHFIDIFLKYFFITTMFHFIDIFLKYFL